MHGCKVQREKWQHNRLTPPQMQACLGAVDMGYGPVHLELRTYPRSIPNIVAVMARDGHKARILWNGRILYTVDGGRD